MDDKELRDAAERHKKPYPRASKSGGKDYVSVYIHKEEFRDMSILAEAQANSMLSDGGELVTEEWLRSEGFQTYKGWPSTRIGIETLPGLYLSWNSAEEAFRLDCCLWEGETRADVRALCRALGIQLKEPS